MKFYLILWFFIMGAISTHAQNTKFFSAADAFFNTHVSNGRVDYTAIKEQPEALNALLNLAQNASVALQNSMEYQAFWINTYNLLVIKGIVDNYPLNSPLEVDGFFDTLRYQVGGKSITLNEIENELLRANFPNEPRFHFALVCAGLGCPPIINEAYTPKKVNGQLQQQTTKALNDPMFIRVDDHNVQVSQLFEWYKEDFERAGGIIPFLNTYRDAKLPADINLGYYEYNWNLNKK